MTTQAKKTFGEVTRSEREAKGIGLRQMAKMINVSPTYLSQVERDVFAPPTEDKVKAMAEILGRDADELLALAGRVPSDVSGIIIQYPRLMALLRDIERFVAELTDEVGPLHELGSPEWITEYAARLEADPTLVPRVFDRAKLVEHLSAALTDEAAIIHDVVLRNLAEASLAKNEEGSR